MNLLHLKYLVEVEKCGSISKAAHALYMNQPHLSKIIKEMESDLNFKVFERNSKGVVATKKGHQFIQKAKKIISEVDHLENMYREASPDIYTLDISVPRASYVSEAFMNFFEQENYQGKEVKINYQETNTSETIKNIYEGEDNIGIIRLPMQDKEYYQNIMALKGLDYEVLFQFDYCIIMSQDNPLAHHHIYYKDLQSQIELLHGDISLPEMPLSATNHIQEDLKSRQVINIYERASQFEILQKVNTAYMWVSPMPQRVLKSMNLVQKVCQDINNTYIDVIITRKGYQKTTNDLAFIHCVKDMVKKL